MAGAGSPIHAKPLTIAAITARPSTYSRLPSARFPVASSRSPLRRLLLSLRISPHWSVLSEDSLLSVFSLSALFSSSASSRHSSPTSPQRPPRNRRVQYVPQRLLQRQWFHLSSSDHYDATHHDHTVHDCCRGSAGSGSSLSRSWCRRLHPQHRLRRALQALPATASRVFPRQLLADASRRRSSSERKSEMNETPNHSLQRTAPRVTVAAISSSNPSRPSHLFL